MRTLGELIDTLKAHDPELPVLMGGATGLGFQSWRGVYAEVSLVHGATLYTTSARWVAGWGCHHSGTPNSKSFGPAGTVGELLAAATLLVDSEVYLTGYKGGEFRYYRHTSLWADVYGECPGSYISHATETDRGLELNRVIKTYNDN